MCKLSLLQQLNRRVSSLSSFPLRIILAFSFLFEWAEGEKAVGCHKWFQLWRQTRCLYLRQQIGQERKAFGEAEEEDYIDGLHLFLETTVPQSVRPPCDGAPCGATLNFKKGTVAYCVYVIRKRWTTLNHYHHKYSWSLLIFSHLGQRRLSLGIIRQLTAGLQECAQNERSRNTLPYMVERKVLVNAIVRVQ